MVKHMAKKTKFKLKKKYKRYLLYIVLIGFIAFLGFSLVENMSYKDTDEYRLKEKGYDEESVSLIEHLPSEEKEYLLSNDKIDYIKYIISDKYYMDKFFYKYLEYYESNSKLSFDKLIKIVNVGATRAWYEDISITDTSDKYRVLVNKFYSLPDDYDAGNIKKFSATYAYGDVYAEETCYNAFIGMAKAAKADGVTLILTSGYRSHDSQKSVYEDMVSKRGATYADEHAARPGQSEHETGLALDILTYNGLLETFKTTEAYAWLQRNAQDYGFIERYREGEEYLTGYSPESWHYRYVGVELAQKVKNEGITYEEYYAFYLADE